MVKQENIIAYCGIECTDCSAYKATQSGSQQALEEVAKEWQQAYNIPLVSVEMVTCDGCLKGERKGAHCFECEIRACGITVGVANCAHCPDYACSKLESFFNFVPDARQRLDTIREELSAASSTQ
jgi:hypothetical protein